MDWKKLQCPGGSDKTYTGGDTGYLGCRCPANNAWNNTKKGCYTCPRGTSLINTGGSIPELPGCKCAKSLAWNVTTRSCYGCPTGTNSTNTGGYTSNNPGCKCPSGYVWSSSGCVQCSAGQFAAPDKCYNCPLGTYNSTDGSTLCTACPVGTTTANYGAKSIDECNMQTCPSTATALGTGQEVPGMSNCKCPNNNTWNDTTKSCEPCPDGHGFNGTQCMKCIGMTMPTGMGGKATSTGCKCPMPKQQATYDSRCVICPEGTNLTNKGGVSNPRDCRCPSGQYYGNGKCTEGCPLGTNSTNTGNQAYGVYGGVNCFCPVGQQWDSNTNTCKPCADPTLCNRNTPKGCSIM